MTHPPNQLSEELSVLPLNENDSGSWELIKRVQLELLTQDGIIDALRQQIIELGLSPNA
jgi:hypothetical protein